MPEKLKAILTSRKFYALVAGVALVAFKSFNPHIPLTEEDLTKIVGLIAAYILGTAVEDAKAKPNATA